MNVVQSLTLVGPLLKAATLRCVAPSYPARRFVATGLGRHVAADRPSSPPVLGFVLARVSTVIVTIVVTALSMDSVTCGHVQISQPRPP